MKSELVAINAKNTLKYYVCISLIISFLFTCTYFFNIYVKIIPILFLLYIYEEVIFIPECDIIQYQRRIYISQPIKKYKRVKGKNGRYTTLLVENNNENFKPHYMSYLDSYDEVPVDITRICIKIILLLIFLYVILYKK